MLLEKSVLGTWTAELGQMMPHESSLNIRIGVVKKIGYVICRCCKATLVVIP